MLFTSRSLANLKDRIDIVEVVSRVVTLKRAGSSYKGVCPFHSEKTPSFVVSEQKQIFTCFGCGTSGDAIEFVKRYYNLDFSEAVEKLAQEYGVELEKSSGYGRDLDIYYKINKAAATFFYKAFTEKANKGYAYMKKRGLSNTVLKKFGIGYADEKWDSLYNHLIGLGYDKKVILELGLATESKGKCYDKFRNRVMFPIINTSGKVIGFGGRAIASGDNPKYLNSPESVIFRKKNNLYGLNLTRQSVSKQGFMILVEGYMDTIGLFQGGVENCAASLGTALTENQAKLIRRYVQDVVLSYDADGAGRSAALRGMEVLREAGCRVRVMHVTDGKDPDEFIKKDGRDAFLNLVDKALPYADYKIRNAMLGLDLNDPEQRIECIKEIAKILNELGPVEQDIYMKKVSEEFDISVAALSRETVDASAQAAQKNVKRTKHDDTGTLTLVERDIFRIISLDWSYAEKAARASDIFTSEPGIRIFSVILDDIRENGMLDIDRCTDALDDGDRALISEAIDNIPVFADPETIFSECAQRAGMEALEKEQDRILALLDLAEDTGVSSEEQTRLMQHLREIQTEIERNRDR